MKPRTETPLEPRVFDSLEALPPEARALWLREEPRLQFDQTLGWSELLVAHASEPGERVGIVTAWDGTGRCRGLLPLKTPAASGGMAPRGAFALANYYSSLYAPVVGSEDGEPVAVLRTLLRGVLAMDRTVDALDLNPLSSGAPGRSEEPITEAGPIARALEGCGWSTETYFRFGNWYLEVAGRTYEAYFEGLPSQLRNTVRRKEKKLLSLPDVAVDIARTPEEAERALAGYQKIYAASWKVPEPHPDFIPSLVRDLARRGTLRLGHVRIGEDSAAAQIWVVKDGIASIFKLAYDERFQQVSAGSVLTSHLMRHVLDVDRVRVVDYLSGDDAYKRDWMSHRQERVGVRAYRRSSWRGQVAILSSRVKRVVRPLVRRGG